MFTLVGKLAMIQWNVERGQDAGVVTTLSGLLWRLRETSARSVSKSDRRARFYKNYQDLARLLALWTLAVSQSNADTFSQFYPETHNLVRII